MSRFRPMRRLQLPETIDGVLSFLTQLQDGAIASFDTLAELPFLNFAWKRDVVLASGSNAVAHGLGRDWRGYIVTRANGAATVYAPDTQPIKDRQLTLTASGAVVVDLFVF